MLHGGRADDLSAVGQGGRKGQLLPDQSQRDQLLILTDLGMFRFRNLGANCSLRWLPDPSHVYSALYKYDLEQRQLPDCRSPEGRIWREKGRQDRKFILTRFLEVSREQRS